MSLFDDCNKTDLTKNVTAATCFWLDQHGFTPVETEVPIELGWIADLAAVICPTDTELQELKLVRRKPSWKQPEAEKLAWREEVKPLDRMMTAIVEVKTSRSDFIGDRKWKAEVPADLAYIATPKGLIGASELPLGWGLLEYSESRDCMITNGVPRPRTTSHLQQRNLIHAIALRRDSLTRYEHHRRLQRRMREDSNERKSLIRVREAFWAIRAITRGEYESIEGALGRYGLTDKLSASELKMLGLEALWNISPPSS